MLAEDGDRLWKRIHALEKECEQRVRATQIAQDQALANGAQASKYKQALHVIAQEQHQAACQFQYCPLPECPTCPSAASIARKALK